MSKKDFSKVYHDRIYYFPVVQSLLMTISGPLHQCPEGGTRAVTCKTLNQRTPNQCTQKSYIKIRPHHFRHIISHFQTYTQPVMSFLRLIDQDRLFAALGRRLRHSFMGSKPTLYGVFALKSQQHFYQVSAHKRGLAHLRVSCLCMRYILGFAYAYKSQQQWKKFKMSDLLAFQHSLDTKRKKHLQPESQVQQATCRRRMTKTQNKVNLIRCQLQWGFTHTTHNVFLLWVAIPQMKTNRKIPGGLDPVIFVFMSCRNFLCQFFIPFT